MILGLTGGYCAGKSTVAEHLASAGWTVIDVDKAGHRALEREAAAVAELLGPSAIASDGRPDRRAIGRLVFADPALKARFEAIVHPAMNAIVAEDIARAAASMTGTPADPSRAAGAAERAAAAGRDSTAGRDSALPPGGALPPGVAESGAGAASGPPRGGPPGVCVDAALLYRLPAAEACDAIVEIRAPFIARLSRARSRDGHGVMRALSRLRPQWSAGDAARFADRTIVIYNGGSRRRLIRLFDAALARSRAPGRPTA